MTWLDTINLQNLINYDVPRESQILNLLNHTKPISYKFSRLAGLVLSAVPGKQSNDFRNLRTSEVQTIWIHSENPTISGISGTWLSKTSSLNGCSLNACQCIHSNPRWKPVQFPNCWHLPMAILQVLGNILTLSPAHLRRPLGDIVSWCLVVPKPWCYLKSWVSIAMVEKLGWLGGPWGSPWLRKLWKWWLKAS